MHHDVSSLWEFYYRNQLGKVAQRNMRQALRTLWPNVKGMNVAGYGFAAPFLRPFRKESLRTLCLMPDTQGAACWPREGPNASALVGENHWPLTTGFIDRLIIAHGMETARDLDGMLEEAWRILSPEGKIIVIVPNRSGIWARRENSPFGSGRPFSYSQVEALLERHQLSPAARSAALYMPPSSKRFWLRSAQTAERFGRRIEANRLAGVLIVEAEKRVFALPNSGSKQHSGILKPIRSISPAAEPVGSRSTADKPKIAARDETSSR